MKTSKTFKILFRLVKARAKNDGAPIYVRITVNGNRIVATLVFFISATIMAVACVVC